MSFTWDESGNPCAGLQITLGPGRIPFEPQFGCVLNVVFFGGGIAEAYLKMAHQALSKNWGLFEAKNFSSCLLRRSPTVFHLLKRILFFPLLALKGIHHCHYWEYVLFCPQGSEPNGSCGDLLRT